jgi:hypothetical protein
MKACALILTVFFAASIPAAWGDDEIFTVQIDHFEDPENPGFSRSAFEGRQWDLKSVLQSLQSRGGSQWISAKIERSQMLGASYCLRIRQLSPTNSPIPQGLRASWLRQLLGQLGQRNLEMKMAGATFRVTHPSPCGLTANRASMPELNAALAR